MLDMSLHILSASNEWIRREAFSIPLSLILVRRLLFFHLSEARVLGMAVLCHKNIHLVLHILIASFAPLNQLDG